MMTELAGYARRWRCTLSSSVLCAAVWLGPGMALGQTDAERATARAAAEQGLEAFNAGDWPRAVEYFSKAQGLMDAPTHLLFIARAEEKQGHLVEAREAYIKINRSTLEPDAPQAFVEAKQSAEQELAEVEARLPYANVNVQGGTPTQLVIDGKEFSSAVVGVPMPINPGRHVFKARGEGAESAEVTLDFSERAKLDVNLELVASAAGAAPAEPGSAGGAVGASGDDVVADQGTSKNGMRIGSYVAFGVGAVGLITGTVFLVQRGSKQSDADDAYARFESNDCLTQVSSECRALASEIQGLDDDAASSGTLSTVGFAVGAAGVGAGVALLLLSRDDSGSGSQPAVVPYASWNGLGVIGKF